MDVIVSPVCQIESAFLIYEWKNDMGAHRSSLLARRFIWAPRTNVKMDGFESFSNIIHIV